MWGLWEVFRGRWPVRRTLTRAMLGVSDCVVSWQPRLSRPSQQAFWPPSSSNRSLLVVQIPAIPLHGAWPAIKKWLIARVNTVQFDQLPSR